MDNPWGIVWHGCYMGFTNLHHKVCNAPINVKPEVGGGGNPRDFDCGVYPQGGDFDRS